ncbi:MULTISPECIES: HAD hydrolase-like protein [Microbulbifer]|uniref:HAD hydrolase-like protein n=1 Tax=Microbulbifer celer TaxID=435905 RepID=A0ABW3U5Z6_9GAMM|nr:MULTISPECIES: HAD hydrolase-like protein [Microbulbifer]UFN58475.1 HAD hydrolase-like protein [Microbulbifer celer]
MTEHQWLLFDLDGTISDPAQGFVNSMNYALAAHDLPERPAEALTPHIGPPLEHTLSHLCGSEDPILVQALVDKYRERYAEVGYAENALYAGIPELLAQLGQNNDIKLAVCTSKRADFAERILDMFGLLGHFQFVSGGDVGIAKWQQLETLLATRTIDSNALMIGDRHFDLTAAHKNGLPSAGVLWGYGSREELAQHSPRHLFSEPADLLQLCD